MMKLGEDIGTYVTKKRNLTILILIISLIGLLNQGYFGALITYLLVFIFGSWYYLVLLGLIYLGFYLFLHILCK